MCENEGSREEHGMNGHHGPIDANAKTKPNEIPTQARHTEVTESEVSGEERVRREGVMVLAVWLAKEAEGHKNSSTSCQGCGVTPPRTPESGP